MNGSNNAGGKLNLSGTYGLGLEMDPWAYEARGRNRGIEIGRQEGYSNGYSSGISVGNDEGLISGIGIGADIAWNEANAIIEKLNTDLYNERYETNCYCVFVNALRRTVETLIDKNPNSASYIRRLFRENYENEVEDFIKDGMIYAAPHVDPRMPGGTRIKRFVQKSYS